MFTRFVQWCLSWLGYDVRGLFRYYDGRRWRVADPLEITRALFDDDQFDWDDTPSQLQTGFAPTQLAAFKTIGNATRKAFGIPEVARGGLTDTECLELLTRFRDYMGFLKKNGSLFPISQSSTASKPSPEKERFPEKPGLDFGSTASEPLAEPPGSLAEQTRET